ncbi:cytidylyltransferase domain-containing protein [Undibacter mobilis]|uniref:Acylneuraminate cytidylyltransferase family protein n=1 Tax=Undibacter mobilis TaxID=2292256 RepID=A0A371B6W7_9BRAD|nr:acylneuraminate cytidylyltransferase family protein [Undibacter mobilis]RDV03141.1 acylneuraminate cytidylyltransferase family protein [Undibacter mobilis]
MRLLAIIPARGGSKGVPRKNIRPLAGRPLIAYSIDAARGARSVDRVVVSTDDAEIAEISRALGADVRMRPAVLAEDKTPTRDVLEHVVNELAAEGYRPDAVLTLQPTSPLRLSRHIDEAAAQFAADPQADSLVSCIDVPHVFHPRSVMRRDENDYMTPFLDAVQPTRRQDKEPVFARNGAAIYITRTDKLRDYVFGGKLLGFMMDAEASIDIDTLDDFDAAERILQSRR